MAAFFLKKRTMMVFSGVQTTPLEKKAVGFDEDITNMPGTHQISENGRQLFEDRPNDPLKIFQIGVRISNRHASVIVHEPEPTGANDPTIEKPLVLSHPILEENIDISSSNTQRQIHIRFEGDKMVLAADVKKGKIQCPRYVKVCRVLTTWKQLQHIALNHCLQVHSIVVDDCATFTSDFSRGLLNYFVGQRALTHEEVDQHMKELDKFIVIVDESARPEASSRRVAASRPVGRPSANIGDKV